MYLKPYIFWHMHTNKHANKTWHIFLEVVWITTWENLCKDWYPKMSDAVFHKLSHYMSIRYFQFLHFKQNVQTIHNIIMYKPNIIQNILLSVLCHAYFGFFRAGNLCFWNRGNIFWLTQINCSTFCLSKNVMRQSVVLEFPFRCKNANLENYTGMHENLTTHVHHQQCNRQDNKWIMMRIPL